jgi:hypothetical protein
LRFTISRARVSPLIHVRGCDRGRRPLLPGWPRLRSQVSQKRRDGLRCRFTASRRTLITFASGRGAAGQGPAGSDCRQTNHLEANVDSHAVHAPSHAIAALSRNRCYTRQARRCSARRQHTLEHTRNRLAALGSLQRTMGVGSFAPVRQAPQVIRRRGRLASPHVDRLALEIDPNRRARSAGINHRCPNTRRRTPLR